MSLALHAGRTPQILDLTKPTINFDTLDQHPPTRKRHVFHTTAIQRNCKPQHAFRRHHRILPTLQHRTKQILQSFKITIYSFTAARSSFRLAAATAFARKDFRRSKGTHVTMKITCNREKLLHAFQTVAAIAPARSPKPILQNVKLEVTKDAATLMATDLEVGIRYEVTGIEVDAPVPPSCRSAASARSCAKAATPRSASKSDSDGTTDPRRAQPIQAPRRKTRRFPAHRRVRRIELLRSSPPGCSAS